MIMEMAPRQYNISNAYAGVWDMYVDGVNNASGGNIFRFDHSGSTGGEEEYIILDRIVSLLGTVCKKVRSRYLGSSVYVLTVDDKERSAVVQCTVPDKDYYQSVDFLIVGERELALSIKTTLASEFDKTTRGTIRWYRKNGSGVDSSTIVVDGQKKMYSEFYPWIKEGVEDYIERFMGSESSILLMIGPPGTGKTSFLRHLISSRNITANVTYDEELLSSDEFFYSFIASKSQLLVIEDADNLISSRDSGNRLIPRFLNTAEGLVKVGKKKMIFTTNLPNVQSVDEALIRPGRCFDVMKTRPLTHDEMIVATKAAGLTYVVPKKEEYSLSEMFSSSRPALAQIRRVGF